MNNNFRNILRLQNNLLKKQSNLKIELPENKLKLFIESSKTKISNNDKSSSHIINTPSEKTCSNQLTVENVNSSYLGSSSNSQVNLTQQNKNSKHSNLTVSSDKNNTPLSKCDLKQKSTKSGKNKSKNDQISKQIQTQTLAESVELTEKNKNEQDKLASDISNQLSTLSFNNQQNNTEPKFETVENMVQSEVNAVNQCQLNSMVLLKPAPKLVDKLLIFLSEDLIRKTLQVFISKYFNLLIRIIYIYMYEC